MLNPAQNLLQIIKAFFQTPISRRFIIAKRLRLVKPGFILAPKFPLPSSPFPGLEGGANRKDPGLAALTKPSRALITQRKSIMSNNIEIALYGYLVQDIIEARTAPAEPIPDGGRQAPNPEPTTLFVIQQTICVYGFMVKLTDKNRKLPHYPS